MYELQYSSMYNSRYNIQSKKIIGYGVGKGHLYSEYLQEQSILLVGTLEIKYQEERILETYGAASRELSRNPITNKYLEEGLEEVHSDENTNEKSSSVGYLLDGVEYFLESPVLERVKLVMDTQVTGYLVDGVVIGVVGQRNEHNEFVVKEIIHVLDAIEMSGLPLRKHIEVNVCMGKGEKDRKGSVIIMPNTENIKNISEESTILLLELPTESLSIKNRILSVPSLSDMPLYMVPWSFNSLPNNTKFKQEELEGVVNPSIIEVNGISIGVVNIRSVKNILRLHKSNHSEGDYFKALKILLKNLHLSPLSPFSCPTVPANEDRLVMDSIPDLLVLKCNVNSVQTVSLNGVAVHLVLVKDTPVVIKGAE